MSKQRAQYRPVSWWLTIAGIGQSLRERYDVPAELLAKLLRRVEKLGAIEGNHLLRNLEITPDHAPTSKKAFDDLSLCT